VRELIKAVVFDLDDTLISEKSYTFSGFDAVSQILSKDLQKTSCEIATELKKLYCKDSSFVFNRLLDNYDFPYNQKYIETIVEAFRLHQPKIEFYSDVMPFLAFLKSMKIKAGIITDGYSITQKKKLEQLKASELFEAIIVTDDLGGRDFWKPNPMAFQLMRSKLKVKYSEMIYVGDNPSKDFYISQLHPVKTVKILRELSVHNDREYYKGIKEHYQVQSLGELVNIIIEK